MKELIGKKLLIIGGAFQHCKLVEAAHEMGVIVYVVDYLPVEKAPAKQIADFHYEYNITDYDEIVEMCLKEGIDGILASHLDACQIPYQVICERLGLPCFGNAEQFRILTDKTAFLKCCQENGVDIIPQYTEDDFVKNPDGIEYPVFIKPCDSRGSRGQTVCYSPKEVDVAIAFAKSESKTGKVVIEKYMGGKQEFTMSYLVIDSVPHLLRTGDRFVGSSSDHMNKSSVLSLSPSMYSDQYWVSANNNITEFIKRIGLTNAPIFMQGFIDDDKFRFFDPGLRFPGCEYDRQYHKITGIDVSKYLVIFSITGTFPDLPLEFDEHAELNNQATAMLFIVIKPGMISKIRGLEVIQKSNEVISVSQRYDVGDTVGEYYNVNQRFCEIDLICDSRQDLADAIDWIYETLQIIDTEGNDMKMSMFDTSILR